MPHAETRQMHPSRSGVARRIAIKTKYDLWVTQPERMAMTSELNSCEGRLRSRFHIG
jgi:hypothetical protein